MTITVQQCNPYFSVKLQQVASATILAGSEVTVPVNATEGVCVVRIGRASASAGSNQLGVIIQGNPAPSGQGYDDMWVPITVLNSTGLTAAPVIHTTESGATNAGATSITLTSGTGLVKGQVLFLNDTAEFFTVGSFSSAVITPAFPLVNAHADTTPVYSGSEFLSYHLGVQHYARLRALVDTASAGTETAAAVGVPVYVGVSIWM